ncbi:MAG: OsmC family protein [Terriglobales bacterium]
MPVRNAEAVWQGDLAQGRGNMQFDAYDGPFSFRSRMEEGPGTNPEELLGAAHAGCFSMALAAAVGQAGFTPKYIRTRAAVHFGKDAGGFSISGIDLTTEADIAGIDEVRFQQLAAAAKENCPVSKALRATAVTLTAKLVPPAAGKRAG